MVKLPQNMELNAEFHLQLMNFDNTLRYTLGHQGTTVPLLHRGNSLSRYIFGASEIIFLALPTHK